MMRLFVLILLCPVIFFMPFGGAVAETETARPGAGTEEEKFVMPPNPYLEELRALTDEIAGGLNEDELRVLYHIRQSFGITRSVGIVRNDIARAVELCGEANLALKTAMDNRFKEWVHAVNPVLDESEGKMEKAIDKQSFREPADIRDYLQLVRKMADFTDAQIKKFPVTTEDACKSLLQSMNSTQDHLLRLMEALAIPPELNIPASSPAGLFEKEDG